ncbi:hypothetical protein GMRT_13692 [Giardia muris]|uniref:Glutamyl-tRNA reductase n=1 Tax=Giardia muris TaxID=5742 RepID=A0A4Z1TDR5_GIAMU|nr:hypothetical protein GMRT_13692 [Giardia muris]|eukprot:TNJ30691.1 hypothetical protein GMRT_13692 [Giardia muris]
MRRWYAAAALRLLDRPFYAPVRQLVSDDAEACMRFLQRCHEAVNKLEETNTNPSVAVVGTGRLARRVIQEVLLDRKRACKALALGIDSVHAELLQTVGVPVSTDPNTLLRTDLIIVCASATDLGPIRGYIDNYALGQKTVWYANPSSTPSADPSRPVLHDVP